MRSNVAINLAGNVAPLLAALFALPILVESLGPARFAILSLAWVVIGYFSLFDLGLGRALTKHVSAALGEGREADVPGIVATALALMLVLGLVGGGALALAARPLVDGVMEVPAELREETLAAFLLLSIGIPLVIVATGLNGVLEAYQRFGLVHAVRIPTSLALFFGPVLALPFSRSLAVMVGVIVACRAVALLAYVAVVRAAVPALRRDLGFRRARVGPLLRYGGWLAVSNVVGPLMLYADRFFLAAMVPIAAVAYYTVPFEVVTRALVVPAAIAGVMFPAVSEAWARGPAAASGLYRTALAYTAGLMIPATAVVLVAAGPALDAWLNAEYAARSTRVAQILMVGVLINGFGLVSQAFVQAAGRPDLTAKLHLIEAPLYAGYLTVLAGRYGIEGAAVAWLVRVTLSAIALAVLAETRLRRNNRQAT